MLRDGSVCSWLLFGHYYRSGTQVMVNVSAHSDIFLPHLTNIDMIYVVSYATVLFASAFVPFAVVP
jgi:hypothetical protein